MKKLMLILVFVFFAISVKAQCNLKTEKDQFTGDVTRSTKYELVCMGMSTGTLKFRVNEFVSDRDTSLSLLIYVNTGYLKCFNENSKISINASGTIINLNLLGDIICGATIYDYAHLDSEVVKVLKQNPINAIRVYYSEGYDDFNIKNKTDYFIKTLKCFE